MSSTVYYIACSALSVMVLVGIYLMSKVKLSRIGNGVSALAMLLGIILVLIKNEVFRVNNALGISMLFVGIAIGSVVGLILNAKVKMIQMPQLVALLNGVGGAASAIVGALSLIYSGADTTKFLAGNDPFSLLTAALAVAIGMVTLIGSLVAAGKLHRILPQKPIVLKGHQAFTVTSLVLIVVICVLSAVKVVPTSYIWILVALNFLVSGLFGMLFSIRVGGADMPITISLLNSLSGVAGAIAGLAINDLLLVAVGGIVGASGLLLTQIMCKAINRSLMDILLGKTSASSTASSKVPEKETAKKESEKKEAKASPIDILNKAKDVIIVPGYGMAIAQAQYLVKKLADTLQAKGAKVRYAIHPVAGRMPGHMNVLLCEADVDYEDLYEMQEIDSDFAKADACIIVGANDVTNPAAKSAVGTPIYGMPVLSVEDCKDIFIFNYDTKPGYAGVDNPLYTRTESVHLYLGNAADTLNDFIKSLVKATDTEAVETARQAEDKEIDSKKANPAEILNKAKDVIIVPGYGMAIAQAQYLVKKLADTLQAKGAKVRYAIHPVAGRMPGHMNVLLCEADVDYEDLYEMQEIDSDFAKADACIIVGANDVTNPAAKSAIGTPIYGMPVLSVEDCKDIFIFNYDTKPGYAGVDNPLYTRTEGVHLYLGNAADTLNDFIKSLDKAPDTDIKEPIKKVDDMEIVRSAKKVIIVPGYGMAIAQAQHLVKRLADKFQELGAEVKYAIHPVAGRMPGHMNVLLCEADVDYEDLFEMQEIDHEFEQADIAVVVGANDVTNPAARSAVGTPIYGMPVLSIDKCKNIFIFNYDTKPGYAGVDNPLYTKDGVHLYLGDAANTLADFIARI